MLITGANGVVGSDLVKFFQRVQKFLRFIERQIL